MADQNKYHNGQSLSNSYNLGEYNVINGQSKQEAEETDIKQQLYTVWHHKWFVVITIAIFSILSIFIAYSVTPIYRSEGSILISDSKSNLGALGGGANNGLGNILSSTYGIGLGSTLANELEVLRSRKLSFEIADTLLKKRLMENGRQYPVLFRAYPDDSTATSQDTVAMRLRQNLSFSQINPDADLISVAYESPSPREAEFVTNAAINIYNGLSTREKRNSANSAVGFLEKEKTRIQGNLHEATEKLRMFMNHSKLVQVDAQTQGLIKQMADLESSKEEARAKLVAANSAIKEYQHTLDTIKPGLSEQYSEAVGPNISKLVYAKTELEVKKQQLLIKNPNLSDTSPQIADLDRQIEAYKKRIKNLTQNLINKSDEYLGFLGSGDAGIVQTVSTINQKLIELQVEQKQSQSQIDVVTKQLNKQEQFFNNLPDNIVELARLKRDVKINEELYITVSQQYAETKLYEQTQFGNARIVDRGNLPKKPVKPRKSLYAIAGFMLGAVLSIAFIFVRDAFNTGINSVGKMRKMSEPLLAVIPQLDGYIKENFNGASKIEVQGKEISTSMITVLDSISPASESYRRLQNNIIYSNPDKPLKSIMVTSSGKGEGKTTTIANLGVVLAEAGHNVIIVDTDLRRPNLHNMFGMKKSPGIVEVLFDDIGLLEATKESVVPGLSILSSGRKPANPATITQSRAFLNMIKNLKDNFDFVLIDTPPFGIITDASALIREVDGLAVVTRFNETSETQLTQTLEQLRRVNASVIGTVLTAFDHKKSSDYYYGSNYYKQVYEEYNSYQSKES